MLSHLPLELLLNIISQLEQGDLRRLCLTSKSLHALATPTLFHSLTIHTDEFDLDLREVDGLLRASRSENGVNLLHRTRDVQFVAAICYDATATRCAHDNSEYYDSDDEEDKPVAGELEGLFRDDRLTDVERESMERWMVEDYMEDRDARLANRCLAVLVRCKEGALKSFGWRLGICVPEELLGRGGYLPSKQPQLEELTLVTNNQCEPVNYDLSGFADLKALSWTGLRYEDINALMICFERTSQQLKTIELDFWTSENMGIITRPEFANHFAEGVLQVNEGDEKLVFPVIENLSLSGISFQYVEKELALAFNFKSIQSLKLRFCSNWEGLLSEVVSLGQPIHLKSFTIQSNIEDCNWDDEEEEEIIPAFLNVVEGLEDLYIATSSPSDSLGIWCALVRHKSTLRSFVHHQRNIKPSTNLPYDVPDLSFGLEDCPWLEDRAQNPLSNLQLKRIGMSCVPRFLKPILIPLIQQRSLNILHVRESGSDRKNFNSEWIELSGAHIYDSDCSDESDESNENEDENEIELCDGNSHRPLRSNESPCMTDAFHEFAQWAFGKNGFPSLQLLVYGDLSYGGQRHSRYNVFLCRDSTHEGNYRRLRKSTKLVRSLLHQYGDFLQACPSDLLFYD